MTQGAQAVAATTRTAHEAAGMLAQAAPAGPDMGFFLMLGSIFLIFYMLVLRPENKRRKEHEEAIKKAEKGDQVVTTGGIHGRITGTTDDVVTVEVAALKNGERVRLKVNRSALQSVSRPKEGREAKGGDS